MTGNGKKNDDTRGQIKSGTRPNRLFPRCLAAAAVAAVAAGFALPAHEALALWDDRLELFASESITHDSNVFRLSDDVDAAAAIGSSEKSDTIYTTSLGFNLDVPYGRQRFVGGYAKNYYRYDRFSVLDFDGSEARAAWLWQAGNDWSGQAGYTETRALASFATIGGVAPNPLKIQYAFANAAYLIVPSIRIGGGLDRRKYSNDNAALQVNNVEVDGVNGSLTYISRAGNEIGLEARWDDGDFENPETVGGVAVNNDYEQRTISAVGRWDVTGISRLSGRLGLVDRSYDTLGQRDFDGVIWRAVWDWRATGKLTVSTVAQRDISATEDITTSFVLVKGVAVRPTLALSEKITLAGNIEYADRDYLGDPGIVVVAGPQRSERVRTLGLSATYRPVRPLSVILALLHQTRSSNIALSDYDVNVVSLTLRLGI